MLILSSFVSAITPLLLVADELNPLLLLMLHRCEVLDVRLARAYHCGKPWRKLNEPDGSLSSSEALTVPAESSTPVLKV